MTGFRKEMGIGWCGLGEGRPIAALLFQPIIAEPTQEHIVRSALLGMRFEAVALEILGKEGAFGGLLLGGCGDRVAENWQATVLLPELAEAALDTVGDARHIEAASFGLCDATRGQHTRGEQDQEYQEAANVMHSRNIPPDGRRSSGACGTGLAEVRRAGNKALRTVLGLRHCLNVLGRVVSPAAHHYRITFSRLMLLNNPISRCTLALFLVKSGIWFPELTSHFLASTQNIQWSEFT